jgi:hypothetical protein
MIKHDEIVLSTWALGPTFRKQLRENILKLLEYKETFKFVILTDYVEDFQDIKELTPKCLAVLDINEQRKGNTWSFENEPIAEGLTDEEYTKNFRALLHQSKTFSYSLHRFSLRWILNQGYKKVLFIDPDVHLQLSREGSTLQEYVDWYLPDIPNSVIGGGMDDILAPININYFNLLCKELGVDMPMPSTFKYTDGPIRFWNFKTKKMFNKFLDAWEVGLRVQLSNPILHGGCRGGVFINDETLFGAIYGILGMTVHSINHRSCDVIHRIENRHFMPSWGSFKLCDNQKEFIETNMEELRTHYENFNHKVDIDENGNIKLS